MKILIDKLHLVFFIILIVLGFSTESFSCLCRRPRAIELLKANDTLSFGNEKTVIIKGKVISNKVGSHLYNDMNNRFFPVANVKVLEFWPKDGLKLEQSDTITIFEGDTYCSMSFIEDSTFLVLAKRENRYYYSHGCRGIVWIPKGEIPAELQELGPGTKPINNLAPVTETIKKEEINVNKKIGFLKEYSFYLFLLSLSLNIFLIVRLIKLKK